MPQGWVEVEDGQISRVYFELQGYLHSSSVQKVEHRVCALVKRMKYASHFDARTLE